MQWFFVVLALVAITQIWLSIRVGRTSVALAIVTLIIGFPGALYTFFAERGNSDTSVTRPFVANLICSLAFIGSIWFVIIPALEAQEASLAGMVAASTAPLRTAVGARAPASAAQGAAIAASSASAAAPADSVDTFSALLRSGGLNHKVARLQPSTLPKGVTEAALFTVDAVSAPGSTAAKDADLTVTLFKCASAADCRNLAGSHMQQADAERKRVLPKGLLMLSMPANAAEGDLTPAAVASAFRKL